MKISKTLLKTIAASVLIGGAVTSCVNDKEKIEPDVECETGCCVEPELTAPSPSDYIGRHIDNCPACGLG